MEKIDQGNKAKCEALQNLTTYITSLKQTSSQCRLSAIPKDIDRSLRM